MLSLKEAAYLAELSKIHFSDEELSAMARDMGQIIELMDSIKSVEVEDTGGDESVAIPFKDLRADSPQPSFDRADIMANAKGARETFFVTRRVVE